MFARIGTDNDVAIRLDADHSQICKFENAKTSGARYVLQAFDAALMPTLAQPAEGKDGTGALPSLEAWVGRESWRHSITPGKTRNTSELASRLVYLDYSFCY
jgi:hypothetical protein